MAARTGTRSVRRVSYWLVAAGVLAALTAALHTFAGTGEIQEPVLTAGFDSLVMLEVYAVWHLVSVALALSAGALLWAAWRGDATATPLVLFVSALWALFGAVFIVVDLALAGAQGLIVAPQWTILLLVGALGFAGTRKRELALTPGTVRNESV